MCSGCGLGRFGVDDAGAADPAGAAAASSYPSGVSGFD